MVLQRPEAEGEDDWVYHVAREVDDAYDVVEEDLEPILWVDDVGRY